MSSAQTSPPEAGGIADYGRGARSAIWRLTAVYVLAFLAAALLFVGGAFHLVRAKNVERIHALVTVDLETLLEKVGGGPPDIRVEKARAVILTRTANRPGPRLYRLEAAGGLPVGNVPAQAQIEHSSGRWLDISHLPAGDGSTRGIGRRVEIAPGASILLGRRLEDGAIESELFKVALYALGFAAIAAFVVGPWASRRILHRVEQVNRACDAVKAGALEARAPGADTRDEFGALARHVNDMLERINSLIFGLRDVSNRVAHDLRTPVARLKADLEAVANAGTLQEAKALAGAAAAETDEILQTFEALLDIAEVEAGSDGGLRPIRLDDAARDAVNLYGAVAEDRGATLKFEAEPTRMLGERSLVIRLAANLIDNAIKFSPPGSEVTVQVMTHGGEAVLVVADRGPGVPANERELIFRRFTRGEGSRSTTPGHGLGLALVAAVAKRHGARVTLEDASPGLRVRTVFRAFDG